MSAEASLAMPTRGRGGFAGAAVQTSSWFGSRTGG